MTYAEAVIVILRKHGKNSLWLSNQDIWYEAYDLKNAKVKPADRPHPIKIWKAVSQGLRRSNLFVIDGYIRSYWVSDRETSHPVFKIAPTENT